MKLSDILKNIRKSTNSKPVSECMDIIRVNDWISSGSYAVNRALTGDIYKGFPQGRVSVVYGDSGSGKSFIVANTIIDAIKNNKVDVVFYLDTEGGGCWDYIQSNLTENELSRIEYNAIATVDECKKVLVNTYDNLDEAAKEYEKDPDNNQKIRALVVLDSFGMLGDDKSFSDITEKDKIVADMGVSAKSKNSLISMIAMRVVRTNTALIIVNHSYDDPAAFCPSPIKPMPGGKKLEYVTMCKLQLTKKLIKSSDVDYISGYEEVVDKQGRYKGTLTKLLCVKNRCAKPGYECEMFISYDHGIQKWIGLVNDAVKFGYIQEVRGGYVVPSYSDKRITLKELVSNDDIWNTFIEKFNADSIKNMEYSTNISNDLDEMEKEFDESIKTKKGQNNG